MTKKGFTLVELIVVITIIAILGTISFVSFQGYSKSASDSKTVADISNTHKKIALFKVESGFLPKPDNSIHVYAGPANIITFQGEVGKSVKGILDIGYKLENTSEQNYKYSTNGTQRLHTLIGYLEVPYSGILPSTFADSSQKYLYFKGDDIVTLFDENNEYVSDDILDIKKDKISAYLGRKQKQQNIDTDSGNNIIENIPTEIIENTSPVIETPTEPITPTPSYSSCNAGTLTGTNGTYSYSAIDHDANTSSIIDVNISNGSQKYTADISCTDGTATIVSESANAITCNADYEVTGNSCTKIVYNSCNAGTLTGTNGNYPYSNIAHNANASSVIDVNISNGFQKYTADITCNDGITTIVSESANAITCSANYEVTGNTCTKIVYNSCNAGTLTGTNGNYPYSNIAHNANASSVIDVNISNGFQKYTADITCNDGTATIVSESANTITCNTHYELSGSICSKIAYNSCKDINARYPSLGNGNYTINPTGSKEIAVTCDMANGGWTKYLDIKATYSMDDAKSCFDGDIINNSQLDCINPWKNGIIGTQVKNILHENANITSADAITGKVYTFNINASTNPVWTDGDSSRTCYGNQGYFTAMYGYGTRVYSKENITRIWFGKNFCRDNLPASRYPGGISGESYMTYSSVHSPESGPMPGNRESAPKKMSFWIK